MQRMLVVDYRTVSLSTNPSAPLSTPTPFHQRSDATTKRQRGKTPNFAGKILLVARCCSVHSTRNIIDVRKGSIIASARRAVRTDASSIAALSSMDSSSPSPGGVRSQSCTRPVEKAELEVSDEMSPNVWHGRQRPTARSVEIETAGSVASPPMLTPRSPSHRKKQPADSLPQARREGDGRQ